MLWDKSCCGNSALAPQTYWDDNLNIVTSNACFFDYSLDCTMSNPPGRMSVFAEFKDWMRGPQCYASSPLIAEDPVRLPEAFLPVQYLISSYETFCRLCLGFNVISQKDNADSETTNRTMPWCFKERNSSMPPAVVIARSLPARLTLITGPIPSQTLHVRELSVTE